MKSICKTLIPLTLIILLIACKKSQPEIIPTFDYLSSSCQISSFTYSQDDRAPFVPNYDATGRLTEFKRQAYPLSPRVVYAFAYEGNLLKKIIQPVGEDAVPGSKDFVKVEYEYGPFGIETIHQFISVGLYNRPDNRMEFERYEFEYNGPGKPTRMNYSVNFGTTEDNFILARISDFQYDANGNLSKEIIQNPAGFGGSYETQTRQYFFDDKVNNIRPLSFLFFDTGSPTTVFSNNNLIGFKSDIPDYQVKYMLTYDTNGNVTDYGYTFINLIWNCLQ